MTRVRHRLDVLEQGSLLDLERGRGPRLPTALDLLGRDLHVKRVLLGIDDDHVAVLDERYRASDLGFGDDVADDLLSVKMGKC
jgi:hypothetical protein